MKLLSLDTSGDACSVALTRGSDVLERSSGGMRHSETVLGMIEELLIEGGASLKQLDAIAFARGPGSFTSLRIGAGVAQGLALGANLPVLPVSTLAALALAADADKVLAALDARMNQVYWCAYLRGDDGLIVPIGNEMVADPVTVPLPSDEGWVGAGSGWDVHGDVLGSRMGRKLAGQRAGTSTSARAVAELAKIDFAAGRAVPPEQAVPVYVRDQVAVKQVRR
jgi:tRNA threonylcarbamoyladenosine biosynthesis protein TsaB